MKKVFIQINAGQNKPNEIKGEIKRPELGQNISIDHPSKYCKLQIGIFWLKNSDALRCHGTCRCWWYTEKNQHT